ncbi:hypothetical protein ACI65C_004661 [Semiaphis heraclei]
MAATVCRDRYTRSALFRHEIRAAHRHSTLYGPRDRRRFRGASGAQKWVHGSGGGVCRRSLSAVGAPTTRRTASQARRAPISPPRGCFPNFAVTGPAAVPFYDSWMPI